jgi:hypothetical protein
VAVVAQRRHRDEHEVTGPEFGSLYYTDCLSGQGLRGGAGFQFQAVSRDVSHEMMTLTQRSTLYEAPVAWMREHRAVSEYPPSLTHAFDGCYVTARGIYLGAEANGVREGNQFTHAVATADPEAYGMVRPAQLWDAPWWSERPAQGTECDPVDAEPEPGPWGIDAVREWVLGQPDGEDWLTAVCSAVDRVHDEDRQRVLFVATDPSAVLCWLAAATLLLPQSRAVRVTFRVFATNPQYSEHDVLALHPDWAGQHATARADGEFAVFNLVTGDRSPVATTEAARLWVPRFLRGDPYDVLDAVELAHQFATGQTTETRETHEVRAGTADLLASRAVVLGEPVGDRSDGTLLTTWLAGRAPASVPDLIAPVVDAVLAGPTDVPALRALDAAVHRHGQTGALAVRVRRTLFDAEIAGGAADEATSPLPTVPWPDLEEVTALVGRLADTVAPPRFPRLLRTAVRFGVEPRVHEFRTGLHRFVQWWADHPEAGVEPDALPCGPALVDQLRDELAHRLRGPGVNDTATAIYHHWWPLLWQGIGDPTARLDRTVAAAAVAQAGQPTRSKVLATVIGQVVFLGGPTAAETAWSALFHYADPLLDELVWFLRSVPDGPLPATAAGTAYAVVASATSTRLSAHSLDALELLAARGATPPAGRLADLSKQCRALRHWLDVIGTTRQVKDAPSMVGLRTVSAPVLKIRADEVLNALLTGTTLANATLAAEYGGPDLHALLARLLPESWADRGADERRRDTAVALAYLTASAPTCATEVSNPLVRALRTWVTSHPSRHDLVEQLVGGVDPDYVESWRADLSPEKGQLRTTQKKVSAPRVSTVDKKPPADEKKPSRLRFGRRRERE